ncbi:MAG: transketolase C-terminal domain-containing protein [Spirochaetales bacterium]|nr:transketolase C-terminal domain-containing protein [Spirochaetales bacterium]
MSKAMREAFGEALVRIGKTNDKLVVLDADVSGSTKTGLFGKEFPERFYNMGVAEANMAGTAAGIATCGYRPVISAFAIFLALKSTDQIRNVICYNNLPVIIAGGYAGLSDSFDGASHQALTDIAIMRAIPNMTVIVPADSSQVEEAVEEALKIDGPVYIRLCRNPSPDVEGKGPLKIGKADLLMEGVDVTIAACGVTVPLAVEAAKDLKKEGITADVINMATVKPLDREAVIKSIKKTGCLLSVEEHSVMGGLGSAISEAVTRECPVPMDYVGIEDTFTESGPYNLLMEKYGISVDAIKVKAKALASI